MDTVNIPKWNVLYLRQQMALVGQEPVLFSGTIKENISYGYLHGEVTDQLIEDVAKMANIYDFITTLPQGFDTDIGDKVIQL
jgi:ABC-type multidrug transport system fused ATPase/permease subunit